MRAIGTRLAALLAPLACAVLVSPAASAKGVPGACAPGAPLDVPIDRAASRFALPPALLRAVIAVESNFSVFAVSPKGAQGLMQIMPETWSELRLRYALGADPFDPCDNIFAGAAYLRELLNRYGDPGFLAAYNAGPGRYESFLNGTRPLPAETFAYVARISARLGGGVALQVPHKSPDPEAWRHGELFVRAPDPASNGDAENPGSAPLMGTKQRGARPSEMPPDTIFVTRTGVPK